MPHYLCQGDDETEDAVTITARSPLLAAKMFARRDEISPFFVKVNLVGSTDVLIFDIDLTPVTTYQISAHLRKPAC